MGVIQCPEIFGGVELWRPTTPDEKALAPQFDIDVARAMFSDPFVFFQTAVQIKTEGTATEAARLTNPIPTEMQTFVGWLAWTNHWVMTIKHRQAKMSTFFIMTTLLRDCMYINGYEGVLIAHSDEIVGLLFDRLILAYDHLPDVIKVPCRQDNKSKSAKYIYFTHGGSITIKTSGGLSIGSGRSPDRAVISELGEMPESHQTELLETFIPGVIKRHHARVIIETTPGLAGTPLEELWHNALARNGSTKFLAIFLRWVDDPTCVLSVPAYFVLTSEERRIMEATPGCTVGHMYFRRQALGSGLRTASAYDAKYPSGPYEGWRGTDQPIVDADLVRAQLLTAMADDQLLIDSSGIHWLPQVGEKEGEEVLEEEGEKEIEKVQPPVVEEVVEKVIRSSSPVYIAIDSNKPGAEGDPSAFTIWLKDQAGLVGFWSEREEPDLLAVRVLALADRLGPQRTILVFEGNSGEAFTVVKLLLRARPKERQPILYVGSNGRGWWASDVSLDRAHGRLMKMWRDGDMAVPVRSILHQFLHYDGQKKKRIKGTNGRQHHFDLARTVVIAADLLALQTVKLGNMTALPSRDLSSFDPTDMSDLDLSPNMSLQAMARVARHEGRRPGQRKLPATSISATLAFGPKS